MIRKAVIPAAGLGTRFLPATKAVPKEMLPLVDVPVIQHVIEEAVRSGIRRILIVTGREKRAIEDHFDRSTELERRLEARGQTEILQELRRIADLASIHFTRQKERNGLGGAIYCARHFTGDEPFAVLLGSTVVDGPVPATRQLLDTWTRHRKSVLGVDRVSRERAPRHGIVRTRASAGAALEVTDVIDGAAPEPAPSDLAIAGRYILSPAVYPILEQTPRDAHHEVQLTDALRTLAGTEGVLALPLEGRRYDLSDKLDYIRTLVDFGLRRPDLSGPLAAYLKEAAARGSQSSGR